MQQNNECIWKINVCKTCTSPLSLNPAPVTPSLLPGNTVCSWQACQRSLASVWSELRRQTVEDWHAPYAKHMWGDKLAAASPGSFLGNWSLSVSAIYTIGELTHAPTTRLFHNVLSGTSFTRQNVVSSSTREIDGFHEIKYKIRVTRIKYDVMFWG